MGKYRKKPIVIEALQWNGTNFNEIHDFTRDNSSFLLNDAKELVLVVHTLEGDMTASEGDFIICGVNDEFYACKPDVFEKTYEKVDE